MIGLIIGVRILQWDVNMFECDGMCVCGVSPIVPDVFKEIQCFLQAVGVIVLSDHHIITATGHHKDDRCYICKQRSYGQRINKNKDKEKYENNNYPPYKGGYYYIMLVLILIMTI